MTDFLTSLVDRALNRAPVLQRRRLSVFEPGLDRVTPGDVSLDNPLSQYDEEVTSESATPRQRIAFTHSGLESNIADGPAPSHPSSAVIRSPRREDMPRREIPIENEVRQMQKDSPSASYEQTEAGRADNIKPARRPSEPNAEAAWQNVATPPPRLSETIVERKVERERIFERSDSRQENNRDQVVATPRSPAVIQPSKLDQPEERHRSISTQPSEVKPVIQARRPLKAPTRDAAPVIRAASRLPPIRQPQASPAPPTIHVTIGRIEVRATQQTVNKTPSAAAVAPKLSLEEYLRSRGGENR